MKLNELVTPTGTRIYHTLSGDHDSDLFINESSISQSHWELLMACHHQGQCDPDCEEAAKYFDLADYEKAAQYLIDCGIDRNRFYGDDDLDIDDDDQVRDDEAILQYYLWTLAGGIQNFKAEEA